MKRLGVAIVAIGLLAFMLDASVQAQGVWGACQGASSGSAICSDETEATDIVKNIVNVFLFVIGTLSVIMIIHSGFKYTTSRGDAEQVKSAKNTLLYAVVGVIVAILAFAIVNFVLDQFNGGSGGGQQNTGGFGPTP